MTDYKKDNKTAPAIFGRVDYEDVAGKHYWTTICRCYEIESSGCPGASKEMWLGRKVHAMAESTSRCLRIHLCAACDGSMTL